MNTRLGMLFVLAPALLYVSCSHIPTATSSLLVSGGTDAGERAYWAAQMDTRGAARTYAEFKKTYASAPYALQHVGAHFMGRMLYRRLGIDGIGICDASFGFGCYHSFFANAIAEHGIGIVSQLADQCKNRYGTNSTGCEHGIGHGILEYLGPAKLHEAVALCEKTRQTDPLAGCTSGVFMEFNMPLVVEGSQTHPTIRTPGTDLLFPCDTFDAAPVRASCYFEISLWWKDLFGETAYEKVGNLCTTALSADDRTSCLKGWGTIVAELAAYNPDDAERMCGFIHSRDGSAACNFGVSMRLFGAGQHAAGVQMCTKLSGEFKRECEAQASASPTPPDA